MIRLIDVEQVLCRDDTLISEVLSRLSEFEYLFLLVVDEAGRLLGTITDGDVRRAFLRGAKLDDAARSCMEAKPTIGRVGDDDKNRRLFASLRVRNAFLPLVDDKQCVREVLHSSSDAGQVTALIMAGGPGSRLGELTRSQPKPLLSVGDKPILEHVLERLELAGIQSTYIAVHYLAEKIERFVADRANTSPVHLLHESERMGTAGAISRIPEATRSDILVVNADIITQANFAAIESFHQRQGHDATIAVANYEMQVPYGVVRHNEDGIFQGIDEKPRQSYLAAAGIYVLSPQFTALVPPDRPMDMPELLNLGRSIGLRIGVFPIHEYWVDIGRPHDLESAVRDHENGALERKLGVRQGT